MESVTIGPALHPERAGDFVPIRAFITVVGVLWGAAAALGPNPAPLQSAAAVVVPLLAAALLLSYLPGWVSSRIRLEIVARRGVPERLRFRYPFGVTRDMDSHQCRCWWVSGSVVRVGPAPWSARRFIAEFDRESSGFEAARARFVGYPPFARIPSVGHGDRLARVEPTRSPADGDADREPCSDAGIEVRRGQHGRALHRFAAQAAARFVAAVGATLALWSCVGGASATEMVGLAALLALAWFPGAATADCWAAWCAAEDGVHVRTGSWLGPSDERARCAIESRVRQGLFGTCVDVSFAGPIFTEDHDRARVYLSRQACLTLDAAIRGTKGASRNGEPGQSVAS